MTGNSRKRQREEAEINEDRQRKKGKDTLEFIGLGKMCEKCGETPCIWEEVGSDVIQEVKKNISTSTNTVPNNIARKEAYKIFTFKRYNFLGLGNREKVPHCALVPIREEWRDQNGAYMGFKSY